MAGVTTAFRVQDFGHDAREDHNGHVTICDEEQQKRIGFEAQLGRLCKAVAACWGARSGSNSRAQSTLSAERTDSKRTGTEGRVITGRGGRVAG